MKYALFLIILLTSQNTSNPVGFQTDTGDWDSKKEQAIY